jgi:ribosomal protein S18 acetylase RimI-like enzyme
MNEVAFNFATAEDARAVANLLELAYRDPATAGRWDSESHLLKGPRTDLQEVLDLIGNPDCRFLLARRSSHLIGCALIQKIVDGPPAGRAAFGMFATHPQCRNTGLGREILAQAEKTVQTLWKADTMLLNVISIRTELIAWYQRRGYRLTGARRPFPFTQTTGETRRDFDLVEMLKPINALR